MTHPRLAAALLTALALALLAPTLAQARTHHRHHYHHAYRYGLPYDISYRHNYGPGALPGTFAYYDGPSNNFCFQGSAVYMARTTAAIPVSEPSRRLRRRKTFRLTAAARRLRRGRCDSLEQRARHHGEAGDKSDGRYPYRNDDMRVVRPHGAIAQPQQGKTDQREHRQRDQRGGFRERRQRHTSASG